MSEINNTEVNTTETTTEAPAAKAKPKNSIKKADLTVEVLQESLELRDDGNFYWKKETLANMIGDFAGSVREQDGYYSVVFRGTNYSGKQLAEFYKTGAWPVKVVKEKVAKERKERVQRVAPVITEEMKAAAKAKAKAAAEAKKAAKTTETPAGDTETAGDQVAE